MKKILSLILALLMIVSCASFIFAEDAVTAAPAANDETASAYYDAVKFLCNYDIMHGKGDTLGVYDDIKRYEMALFIGRITTGWVDDSAWEDGPENNSKFVDLAGTAAENYYGAISYVANKGIIEGVGGNKFAPEAGIKYEDALTMAVRALGYKDLAYPWGYIEKAVELGLTAGISGVAYTDTLKREVVAQIIYNTLFAENADGETFAETIFGISNNYDVVVITAADKAHFVPGGENTPAGYVGFRKITPAGVLEETEYYTTAASFGLEGEHGDELALGSAYKVIFNTNTDYGTANILSYESVELDPILNRGLDSKSAGKYPIQAFLGDVKLVDSFGKYELNKNDYQFILYGDDATYTIATGSLYAIDWYTGNILKKDVWGNYSVLWYYNDLLGVYFRIKYENKGTTAALDYMTKEELKDYFNDEDFNLYEVLTYSDNACFTTMSKVSGTAYADLRLFDINGDGNGDYGIYDAYALGYYKMGIGTYLDKDSSYYFEARSRLNISTGTGDMSKTYAGESQYVGGVDYGDGHVTAMVGSHPNNDVWTLSDDEWYTLSEIYALGLKDSDIMVGAWPGTDGHGTPRSKGDCGDAGPFMAFKYQGKMTLKEGETLQILSYANVINGGSPVQNQLLKGWCSEYVITGTGNAGGYKQYTGKITQDAVWSAEGSSPVVNEDGSYAEGWMIYTLDPATRQLKVCENIGAYEEGKTTYVATGMLRGFSTSKKTVTIGDTVLSTSYDELAGNAFQSSFYIDNQWFAGAEYLNKLFNQYVTYVVVDDRVVYIEACGAEDYRFLIVSSYAGVSSDGYIVINAWDTADGANKRIRIESCDNWQFGDFFYYGSQNYGYDYSGIFTEDTLLQILSYNAENDSYGVTKIDGLPKEGARVGQEGYMQTYNTALKDQKLLGTGEGLDLVWFEQYFDYAKLGIRYYKYQGKVRGTPSCWNPWKHVDGISVSTPAGLSKNMTEDDTYIFIFAPGEVVGSPIRIYKGVVTDPTWFCAGWRLVGPNEKTHIYFNVKAGNVSGFDIQSSNTDKTYVMIPDYKHLDDLGSWFLPTSGHHAGWQIVFGHSDIFDPGTDARGDFWPWGKIMDANYDTLVEHDDWYLLGNSEATYFVLDLVTMKSITVKADSAFVVEPNTIYSVQNGKIVEALDGVGEFYEGLIGSFGHNGVDLENDAYELFTTTRDINGKNTAGSDGSGKGNVPVPDNYAWAGLRTPEINKWMTKNDKTIGKEYEVFGKYTIVKEAKFVAICALYDGPQGVEFVPFGMCSGTNCTFNQTANARYSEYTVDQVKSIFGGATKLATVTLVNMNRVKMQNNVNPYDGLVACTYCFAQKQVNVNHTYDLAN